MGDEKYLAIGSLCRRMLIGVSGVYCSYNGVILPELPNWDKKTYPYAVITRYLSNNKCFINFYKTTPTVGNYAFGGAALFGEMAQDIRYVATPITWRAQGWGGLIVTLNEGTELVWANFDVIDDRDESKPLYLAKSEPIPVMNGR